MPCFISSYISCYCGLYYSLYSFLSTFRLSFHRTVRSLRHCIFFSARKLWLMPGVWKIVISDDVLAVGDWWVTCTITRVLMRETEIALLNLWPREARPGRFPRLQALSTCAHPHESPIHPRDLPCQAVFISCPHPSHPLPSVCLLTLSLTHSSTQTH